MGSARAYPSLVARSPSVIPRAYAERLTVPWWLWPAALATAGLLAAELHLGAAGLRSWVPYAVLLPATVVVLAWAGRLRIAVADGELRVDDAHVPIALLGEAEVLDAAGLRAALGPELDPLAFVVRRPWVPRAVLVTLEDPADPTPYWIVSTRDPDRLLAALDLPVHASGTPG